jgi:hypothetical protein
MGLDDGSGINNDKGAAWGALVREQASERVDVLSPHQPVFLPEK